MTPAYIVAVLDGIEAHWTAERDALAFDALLSAAADAPRDPDGP